MKQEFINKTKSRGYWRILFEPSVFEEKLKLPQCKEIVEKNSIELRGWDYPHIPKRMGNDTGFDPGQNYWEAWLDWEGYHHKEFWRMYQSGQFIHYLGLYDDWFENGQTNSMWQNESEKIKQGDVLGITGTTYLITEIYQFLLRLTAQNIYDEGVNVSISLNNTAGRQLYVDSYSRMPFSYTRKTSAQNIVFSKVYSKSEILQDPKELALQTIIYFFERFNWSPPNIEVIKKDQENLINRKI